eukprot:7324478-Prymnesium_polylepis.1
MLDLGPDQHRRPPPSIRPCCRYQRPRRHRSRPPPLPMLCPRLHHRPSPLRSALAHTPTHPPLPALVAAAYASHVTLRSTTLHIHASCLPPDLTPLRSKNSELRSFLLHQPEAVNPPVPAGPASHVERREAVDVQPPT